ncbi:MAG: AAA family ATPase, partial [archaeon]|nr:AAA family ATPase [archaeon]
MKLISMGNQDFKDIRNEDAFYVDKTELIEDVVTSSKTKVFLFTRPRRFGKSMNLSMIDAFFNMEYEGNTWFDGLHVEKCEACKVLKNRFPVISIDFRISKMEDKITFLGLFSETISKVYRDFPYLENLSKLSAVQKEMYSTIVRRKANEVELMKSLVNLSEFLFCHHGVPVIILIDEYDNPMQNYHGTRIGDYVLNFVRELMGSALKGNWYLKLAVVTGVLQMTNDNLFSGLNNLYVNNIFSKDSDERYGFTSAEVKQICEDFGHPEKFDECR